MVPAHVTAYLEESLFAFLLAVAPAEVYTGAFRSHEPVARAAPPAEAAVACVVGVAEECFAVVVGKAVNEQVARVAVLRTCPGVEVAHPAFLEFFL